MSEATDAPQPQNDPTQAAAQRIRAALARKARARQTAAESFPPVAPPRFFARFDESGALVWSGLVYPGQEAPDDAIELERGEYAELIRNQSRQRFDGLDGAGRPRFREHARPRISRGQHARLRLFRGGSQRVLVRAIAKLLERDEAEVLDAIEAAADELAAEDTARES